MRLPRFLSRKENPVNRSILATYSPGQAIWTPDSYYTLAEEGYKNCGTAFSCVSLIAKTASRIAWTMSRRTSEGMDELVDHPLLALLAKPNETESGIRFTEKVFSFLLLAGNSYIDRVSGIPSAPPRWLYVLRPDRMQVVAGTSKEPIAGYIYSAGVTPQNFKPYEILHLMEFNPLDDWYGLSRIRVAARKVDISNQADEWNKNNLQNNMNPPGVVTADHVNPDDIDRLRAQFKENYQGYKNAGVPLVFSGENAKWTATAMNPKDVDWLQGQKMTMRSICAIFGVPSMLLGDTEATTYANYQEARKALYMETVLPLMDIYRDELNSWLVPLYGDGLYLDYDRDSIEALQEERAKKYEYLKGAYWIKVNELRTATGYDELGPEGDVALVPLSLVPLESVIEGPAGPAPDAAAGKAGEGLTDALRNALGIVRALLDKEKRSRKQSFWRNPERKQRLWASFETRIAARTKSFRALASEYQRTQAERVRQRLLEVGTVHCQATAIFDLKAETERYIKKLWPWYRDTFVRAVNAGLRASKGELFDDAEFKAGEPTTWTYKLTPAQEEALQEMVFNSGTKVNETTIDIIYGELKRAQEENLPVAKFAQDLHDELGGDLSRSRSMLWARTESAKIDNYGQLEGYRQTEFVDKKGWMCSFVPTSREAHIKADETYADGIPLDEPFVVDGQKLDYPGDPDGDPGNVCNCLCSTFPVVGKEGE